MSPLWEDIDRAPRSVRYADFSARLPLTGIMIRVDVNELPDLWGTGSGDAFARRVRQVLDESGFTGEVEVTPVSRQVAPAGAYLVDVSVHGGPVLLYEVADWVDGARVMDPHGEDLTVEAALRYLTLRIMGASPGEALNRC